MSHHHDHTDGHGRPADPNHDVNAATHGAAGMPQGDQTDAAPAPETAGSKLPGQHEDAPVDPSGQLGRTSDGGMEGEAQGGGGSVSETERNDAGERMLPPLDDQPLDAMDRAEAMTQAQSQAEVDPAITPGLDPDAVLESDPDAPTTV